MTQNREYRWTFRKDADLSAEDVRVAQSLAQDLSISPILAKILVSRRIDTFEKARAYFRPSMEDLHDPFIIDQMQPAVERIIKALKNNGIKITAFTIYGSHQQGAGGFNAIMKNKKLTKHIEINIRNNLPKKLKKTDSSRLAMVWKNYWEKELA